MKVEITEDRKLWSDMEERLGAFTDVSNNADEFYDFWEYWIKNRFNRFIKKHNFSSKDISVITLNYTNTLEKILNLSSGATTKGFDSSNTLRNLIHVHGLLGQSIFIRSR